MTASTRSTLALDIGGTKLAVGVVDQHGVVTGLRITPTRKEDGHAAVVRRLFDLAHASLAAVGNPEIDAVGISCGGPLDAEAGIVHRPLNLPDWDAVPIGPLAAEEFGVPAHLVNDATAGMIAEHRHGVARGTRDALYLTLSTGVGGGAIVDGHLHRGAAANGGEFGHIMVRPGGRVCTCGRRGCLEGYASGTSIALRAREAVAAAGTPTLLSALATVRAEDVVAAAESGDELARQLWAETVEVIGQAVTDLVNTFEPEVVVLGGGVTRAGAMLLDPVRAHVARWAMPPAAAAVRIEFAALGEAVCVVGAAVHASDRSQEPSHA
ncbi:ROK family protein [Homoserinibacter gongjuensis]|uniref:N-acylmannosamine kinase n=1 Tax=Homoserinibacter gongjuensis TaxID=1162968 RepID=A0ABQ6JWM8_9MICO|nr:ROK family protein [Homoserinibacter gongjuensis]GMA91026.1 N-acylmannosamine kinase [Homoserinibacter gongjuensis]